MFFTMLFDKIKQSSGRKNLYQKISLLFERIKKGFYICTRLRDAIHLFGGQAR